MDRELPSHLAIRPLNLGDLAQVTELEALCFSKEQAASETSIKYRLSVCPELTSGMFIRTFGGKYSNEGAKSSSVEAQPHHKKFMGFSSNNTADNSEYIPDETSSIVSERLIGHLLSTKIRKEFIQEADMEVPEWFVKNDGTSPVRNGNDDKVGHVESSDIIGLHSVAVHSEFRGKKIGSLMLHDYLQKLSNQQVGSIISIMAKPGLVKYYESVGFVDKGISDYNYGGAEWHDMHIELKPEEAKM
ncbi:polyamine acetyltransferase [Saccharomycopsis crataegensis]|uniref:Polyamine acetyltransferase n=1 Tax=Saccharomycopsis crataegensis TaxID=43959 RepID=A0AAV5QNS7_9ASCO|nr:polyamine acetyltransferase [Saccharomycopsis crataegensis]